jgi:copper/silver efflux system protein
MVQDVQQRFTVNMRYPRDLRDNPQAIANDVLVPMPACGAVPLGEVAKVAPARGPTSIRTENGQLATYIYVDIRDRDLGGDVADAQRAVQASVQFPPGYYVMWSGQYEYLERATARLKIVIPVTLLIIFLLLYLNFRSITETMIVMLSLPFALVGGLWLMWWLGFNLSVAVAVGFIALAGVAAETGVVMLIYLNQALAEIRARRDTEGRALTRSDLYDAIMEGAVERVRPKMMTVSCAGVRARWIGKPFLPAKPRDRRPGGPPQQVARFFLVAQPAGEVLFVRDRQHPVVDRRDQGVRSLRNQRKRRVRRHPGRKPDLEHR